MASSQNRPSHPRLDHIQSSKCLAYRIMPLSKSIVSTTHPLPHDDGLFLFGRVSHTKPSASSTDESFRPFFCADPPAHPGHGGPRVRKGSRRGRPKKRRLGGCGGCRTPDSRPSGQAPRRRFCGGGAVVAWLDSNGEVEPALLPVGPQAADRTPQVSGRVNAAQLFRLCSSSSHGDFLLGLGGLIDVLSWH